LLAETGLQERTLATLARESEKQTMKITRIDVATAVIGVVLAACLYPVYKDAVHHQVEATSGVVRWAGVALMYGIDGAVSLYCARFVAKWIFAHARDSKPTAL
jgi:hypothetical protein